ncbi:MAG: tRNA (adenosine(37)-N6)-threonylcarbamoyltransferase complex dimerization subunit type 1 TsaB [Thiohalobacterales bacterium]
MATRILAIETATAACSAALYIDGDIQERHALAPRQHAALILPMIESLLVEAGLQPGQLDAIAFGRGPGSFTGVRIAASAVQGIALGVGLPVVAVSTLAALANGALRETGEQGILTALDARMDEVYWAVYQAGANRLPGLVGEESVRKPESVEMPTVGNWVGAGSGWERYAGTLAASTGEHVVRLLPDLEPRAHDVAMLAADKFSRNEVIAPEAAVPVYLRDNVAREN